MWGTLDADTSVEIWVPGVGQDAQGLVGGVLGATITGLCRGGPGEGD